MKISAKIIGEIEHLIDTAYEALEAGDSGTSDRKNQKPLRKSNQENSKPDIISSGFETNTDLLPQNETAARKAARRQFGSLSPAQKAFIYSEILNKKYQD